MLVEKYGWAIQKSLFAETSQDSIFSHTRGNSKMFNVTSKYFSFFNKKPPASWVAHMARDFLTFYSCSYYSSMDTDIFLWILQSLQVFFSTQVFKDYLRPTTSVLHRVLKIWLKKLFEWLSSISEIVAPNLVSKSSSAYCYLKMLKFI